MPCARPSQVGWWYISAVHLREREHEDEVEEQLERRHSLALAHHGADPGSSPLVVSAIWG